MRPPLPLRLRRRSARRAAELRAGRRVGELFEEHGRMVHALCRLNLRDGHEAEDAAQQTFLSAYRSLLGGGEPRDPPAWLAAIARNECRARRARNRIPVVPLDEAEGAESGDVAETVEVRQEIATIAAALAYLTPGQRDAVVLREFYGLSYAEVATALGVSAPAVESLLFKGRRRLQEKLSTLRAASALAMPDSLRDALAQALPGFGGPGAAEAARVFAVPAAAKIAAVAVLATGGGATVVGTAHRDEPPPRTEASGVEAVSPDTPERTRADAPAAATRRAEPRRTVSTSRTRGRLVTAVAAPVAAGRHDPEREEGHERAAPEKKPSTGEATAADTDRPESDEQGSSAHDEGDEAETSDTESEGEADHGEPEYTAESDGHGESGGEESAGESHDD